LNVTTSVPHLLRFGFLEVISKGIAMRRKNHTATAAKVHLIAYTPLPMALKPALYLCVFVVLTPQPLFAFAVLQSV
jgi:hypothetical protein